jgi:hypothetical protein
MCLAGPHFFAVAPAGLLNGMRGLPDHIEHECRVGEHRDVAAVQLGCGGAHALRDKPLQLGMDRAVFRGHDVPARLRLPSGSFNLLPEEVGHRHHLRRPDQLLFLLGQVSRGKTVGK